MARLLILIPLLPLLLGCSSRTPVSDNETIQIPLDGFSEAPDDCLFDWEAQFAGSIDQKSCVGVSVAVVKDGETSYLRGYGRKARTKSDTVGVNTVFRIGSLSKGFSGVAAGIMVDEGWIQWDDPVNDHLPYFDLIDSTSGQQMTIRHILSHTTGFTRHAYTNLIEAGWDAERIGRELNSVPLIGTLGSTYAYQNASFALIGEIAEKYSGRPFDEFLKSRIFDPLEMHNASATYDEIVECDDHALPHSYRTRPMKISKRYYNSIASGGINASIADMALWLEFLIHGDTSVISDEILDEVLSPEVRTRRQRRYYNRWRGVRNSHYAKGWRIIDFGNYEIVHHGGYVNGFRSEIAVDRRNKTGICVLFNSPCRQADKVVPNYFASYRQCEELAQSD